MRKLFAIVFVTVFLGGAFGELKSYHYRRITLDEVEPTTSDLTVTIGSLSLTVGTVIDPDAVMAELKRQGRLFDLVQGGFGNFPEEMPSLEIRGVGFQIVYMVDSNLLYFVSTSRSDWVFGNGLHPGSTVEMLRERFPDLPGDDRVVLDCMTHPFNEYAGLESVAGYFFALSVAYGEGKVSRITARLDEFAP